MERRRTYRQHHRAQGVERTRARVLEAAYELFLARPWDAVTLPAVAARAGVSKQTIIRQFGSKDRLAAAVVDWQRPREEAARAAGSSGIAPAIAALVARYEAMGDANVRSLELECRVPAVRYLLEQARESHAAWVERVFARHLPRRGSRIRHRRMMAFYAATDVTLWKLLRRDFRLDRAETEAVMVELVSALARPNTGSGRA